MTAKRDQGCRLAEFDAIPLILFSGLGADDGIFVAQKLAFPQLVVPRWPVPESGDTLHSYAARIAAEIRPTAPCIVGGASFGGIVALHVACHLDALAVVLIGSVRRPDELPGRVRVARCLRPIVPLLPVSLLQMLAAPFASSSANRMMPHIAALARQFRRSNPAVVRWSIARILDWCSPPVVSCPVVHVHGSRDFVLPVRCTHPDTIVAGGGHVLSATHPREVNAFLGSVMTQVQASPRLFEAGQAR
jgi:pimeloyl-ACP methyl ester carboxylesterase